MNTPSTSYIAGRWQRDDTSRVHEVFDPARAEVIAKIPATPPELVDRAVEAARTEFERGTWKNKPPMERGSVLAEIARKIRAQVDEVALLESLNVGKPLAQARGEIAGAAEVFDYFARLTATSLDELVDRSADQLSLVVREPIGVVAAIVPWNYPFIIAAQALAPALATGCSIVVKPSELTPLSTFRLFEMLDGLVPAGTVNLVLGDGEVGARLAAHPDVAAVLFTGSTSVGQEIVRNSADSLKRVTLELGGKAPIVVFGDAPFEESVANALARVTINQGENCGAGTRLLVHESIHEKFVAALVGRAQGVTIGDPQDETITLGPMISREHQEKVLGYVSGIPSDEVLHRGPVPAEAPLSAGYYAPLTIANSGPGSAIWQDEIFGPVLTVVSFAGDDEAIRLANDTRYGLFASIWAGDRGRAMRMADQLRAGVVRINNGAEPLQAAWGGMGLSGLGRTSGKWSLEAMTEIKTIALGIA